MAQRSGYKDLRKEVERLKEAGWEEVRHTKHVTWKSPCGTERVTVAVSPGRGRALGNVRADITRALRRLEERQHAHG